MAGGDPRSRRLILKSREESTGVTVKGGLGRGVGKRTCELAAFANASAFWVLESALMAEFAASSGRAVSVFVVEIVEIVARRWRWLWPALLRLTRLLDRSLSSQTDCTPLATCWRRRSVWTFFLGFGLFTGRREFVLGQCQ